MSSGPDLAGFGDAQARKREAFGRRVDFLGEVLMTFPPGTPIDPETGHPHDPTIRPSASGQARASATCEVVSTEGKAGGQEFSPLGVTGHHHVLAICPPGVKQLASAAVDMEIDGERHEIVGQAPRRARWLVWGRRR